MLSGRRLADTVAFSDNLEVVVDSHQSFMVTSDLSPLNSRLQTSWRCGDHHKIVHHGSDLYKQLPGMSYHDRRAAQL